MLNHFSYISHFVTLWTITRQPPSLGFSPKTETLAKNTGLGCHFLLQGIFPTQGSNLHLLRLHHYSQILYWSPGKSKLEISEKSLRSLLHRINGHLMVFYFISSCLRFSKDSTLRREEMKKNMGDHWNLGSGTVRVKMKLGTTEAG